MEQDAYEMVEPSSFHLTKGIIMKFRTLILATAVLASATGYAFAQNTNRSPDSSTPDSAKPAGAMKDTMSKDTMTRDKAMTPGTTGMDTNGMSNTPMSSGNVSPASPNAGEKQQK